MNILNNKDLLDQFNKAFSQFKIENDRKLEMIEKKQSLDPLLEEKIEKINNHLDVLEAEHVSNQRPVYNSSMASKSEFKNKQEELDYKYFLDYAIKGEERNLIQFRSENLQGKSESFMGAQGSGGFLINSYLYSKIIDKIVEQSPLRKVANVITVSGNLNEYIQCLDELETGGWVNETDPRTETGTPEFNKIIIKLNEMYTQPRITQQLLFDSSLNIENWLVGRIANAFRMLENKGLLFGKGVNSPLGLFEYNNKTENEKLKIQEYVVTNGAGTSPASKNLTLDNLLGLMYSLDEHFLQNASWIMSPNALRIIRGLKDATSGIYLWQPSFTTGSVNSLLGFPIILSKELPLGDKPGDMPIAFGDFKEGFMIIDSTRNVFIRDQFSYKPFVSFYVTKRMGGSVVNPNAIKIMKIVDKI